MSSGPASMPQHLITLFSTSREYCMPGFEWMADTIPAGRCWSLALVIVVLFLAVLTNFRTHLSSRLVGIQVVSLASAKRKKNRFLLSSLPLQHH